MLVWVLYVDFLQEEEGEEKEGEKKEEKSKENFPLLYIPLYVLLHLYALLYSNISPKNCL